MINITHKSSSLRYARAEGYLRMKKSTIELIRQNKVAKGDVRAIARVAGIESAKRTADWIIFLKINLPMIKTRTATSAPTVKYLKEKTKAIPRTEYFTRQIKKTASAVPKKIFVYLVKQKLGWLQNMTAFATKKQKAGITQILERLCKN